jgi:hypothetical protein
MSYLPNTTIPAKTIANWWSTSGTIPSGWALCNGQTVTMLDGSSVTTPNLIGMFVAGGDIQGGSNTANANGFGSFAPKTTIGSIVHNHVYSGSVGVNTSGPSPNSSTSKNTPSSIASPGHYHSLTLAWSGNFDNQSNMPASYAMVYMMKL